MSLIWSPGIWLLNTIFKKWNWNDTEWWLQQKHISSIINLGSHSKSVWLFLKSDSLWPKWMEFCALLPWLYKAYLRPICNCSGNPLMCRLWKYVVLHIPSYYTLLSDHSTAFEQQPKVFVKALKCVGNNQHFFLCVETGIDYALIHLREEGVLRSASCR